MSITIYDGFMTKITSLVNLNEVLRFYTAKVNIPLGQEIITRLAKEMCYRFDRYTIGLDKDLPDLNVTSAYYDIVKRHKAAADGDIRDPDDYSATIMIYPLEEKTLMRCCAFNQLYIECFKADENFMFYGYWDNVDPDENCSKTKWIQRRTDWSRATSSDQSVIFQPLTYLINYLRLPVTTEQCQNINLYYPSEKERAVAIARDIVGVKNGDRFSVMQDAVSFILSNEYKKEVEEIMPEVLSKISNIDVFLKLTR